MSLVLAVMVVMVAVAGAVVVVVVAVVVVDIVGLGTQVNRVDEYMVELSMHGVL